MPRDPKDTCENCPAWAKHLDQDGKESLVELRGADGKPVTKDGATQYEKGEDGRFVMNGNCCLHAPKIMLLGNGLVTVYPTPKSNWFCEDPERYAMLERKRREKT